MSADLQATETETNSELSNSENLDRSIQSTELETNDGADAGDHPEETDEEDDVDGDEDEDEDEDEPKLKYAKLTGSLGNVYRNGDSTSSFIAVGDKMVLGTHNGNIHVLSLPTMQALRTYRAHQASVTSVSISPLPPPPTTVKAADGSTAVLSPPAPQVRHVTSQKTMTSSGAQGQTRSQAAAVANVPSNQIYIATSSLDGHVCISSLVNPEDVQLRNFARPVNAVALSPEYKSDRTYISGGLAGNLILTVGGRAGVSTDANTNSAAAAASGWFSSLGLASNKGQDKILHSGEGAISSIRWSLSGKWVAWVNEEGIKIMRSHLKLGSEDGEDAWKRIAHAPRPDHKGWEDMSGVWKARCEWVDDRLLESDDLSHGGSSLKPGSVNGRGKAHSTPSKKRNETETLVVGWGDTAWIMHVVPLSSKTIGGSTKHQVGKADIIHKLRFRDCIVAGIAFYTPSLVAILAYRTKDDNNNPIKAVHEPSARKGRQQRRNGLAPQLRLVAVANGEEVEVDELPMSRHEILSAQDYHLGTIHVPPPVTLKAAQEQQKGVLEGMFDAAGGRYASRIFSSSASILSGGSGGRVANGRAYSFASPTPASGMDVTASPDARSRVVEAHPHMLEPGLKLFIQSPYDCVLAVKQDLSDHLQWLITHGQYEQAWHLIDVHPEVVDTSSADVQSGSSRSTSTSRPAGAQHSGTLAEFLADDSSSQITGRSGPRSRNSAVQGEKRRIGDLWIQQLVSTNRWEEAGEVAGRILGTSSRWQYWAYVFAQAGRFDEITPHIPSTTMKPPLPSPVYELLLGHYIQQDRARFSKLLDKWDPELFEVDSIILAIETKLESGDVREDSIENGVKGRDWRILLDALAKLYLADGHVREALRYLIRLQDADRAFELIRGEKLQDAVAEDVPGLVMLRVTRDQMDSGRLGDLEAASSEAIQLLVDEAYRGTLLPRTVVRQLESKGPEYRPFLFFYHRALWNGRTGSASNDPPRRKFNRLIEEGRTLVDEHADLAVRLFAEYDRALLLEFLSVSQDYTLENAAHICEEREYIPELVRIRSKMGQTEQALRLIIERLGDVRQAISFAKEHTELWEDLLGYSMTRPLFIRGLLEEVGAATDFNPIDVVRRIPEGMRIEGLKDGIQKLVREFDIQVSISEGVAKVLNGEVSMGLDTLRAGRRKGVRFEVLHESPDEVDLAVHDIPTLPSEGEALPVPKRKAEKQSSSKPKPGHCVACGEVFHEDETETLIGFACGHVYHLSCLLRANPETKDLPEAQRFLKPANASSSPTDEDSYLGGRPTVGGKVANAHSIKNVLRGGCQHCVTLEGA